MSNSGHSWNCIIIARLHLMFSHVCCDGNGTVNKHSPSCLHLVQVKVEVVRFKNEDKAKSFSKTPYLNALSKFGLKLD